MGSTGENTKKYILLSLLLFTGLILFPPNTANCRDSGFSFIKNYSPDDYNYFPFNWMIQQDHRGIIYVANHAGVMEFDGVSWRIIEIPNRTARSIAIDQNGTIYIGGINEIGFLTPDTNGTPEYKSLLDELPGKINNFSYVFETLCTTQGVYFRTSKYLFRRDSKEINGKKEMKVWKPDDDDSFDRAFVCGDNLFVRQPKTGLMQMKDDSLIPVSGGERLTGQRIGMLIPCGDNPTEEKQLIGTRPHGFYILNHGTVTPFPTEADDFMKENQLFYGTRLQQGNIALATAMGGLLIIDPHGNIKHLFNKSRGLLSDNIKYVYEDSRGNLWLALEKGISKIEYASPFTVYDERSDLPGLVLCVTKHETENRLFAGTTWGLYLLESQGKFRPVPGISSMVHSLLPVTDSLLAASDTGVFQVVKDRVKRKISGTASYVLAHSTAAPGRTWTGGEKGLTALYFDKKGKWTEETILSDIPDIRTIVEEPGGNLWLGTLTNGAVRIDFPLPPDRTPVITPYRSEHGLPPGEEVHVFAAAGRVVFGTGKGLFRFDTDSQRFVPDLSFGEEFANGSRNVFRMAEDINKKTWFHSRDRNFLAVPRTDGFYEIHSKPFLRLPHTQVNGIYPEANGKYVWFAGNDALFRYDTTREKDYDRPFGIIIRKVLVNGKTTFTDIESGTVPDTRPPGFSPVLPFEKRNLCFYLAAPFFEGESMSRYRCFLEGYDSQWTDWDAETQRNYINLDPGIYRFRAQARNVYNNVSGEAVFVFEILPPWYRTWWAYSFYALFLGLLLYSAGRLRSMKLEIDRRKLQRIVNGATKEIEIKNRQLETQTAQLEIQAKDLQEMADVRTRFFANISHELRTPLTLIMGPLEQMLSRLKDGPHVKLLEMMHRNSQRLLTLINQLLALSRIDRGKMKLKACPQDIVSFLKGILASFQLAAVHNEVELSLSSESEAITVYFDPEKLEDVFCNLLLNVVNLTPRGENIAVIVERSRTGAAEGEPAGSGQTPVFLDISVCASGFEIPDDQLEQIFDRFYLAEEAYEHRPKSRGIGLALARELVSLHRGDIRARRCERAESGGGGTEFIIRLPLGSGHLEPGEIVDVSLCPSDFKTHGTPPAFPFPHSGKPTDTQKSPKKEDSGDKLIILLVEDNADARDFISESLEPLYNVVEAFDGKEGIEKAFEIIPDLIISDIIMPRTDGLELCRVLKKDVRTSHIPLILLTAREGADNILRGFEVGADDYIVKPFNLKLLHARIKNLIDLRRLLQLKMERRMALQPSDIDVSSIDEVFIKELQGMIEKNLSDSDFNVDQLAKKLYMSRATLYRKIHALTGEPPHRFIRSYRLNRATQLMKANFGNVSEVAMEVGFTNVSYFSQCFKEKFHQLPSEFQAAEAGNSNLKRFE